MQIYLRFLIVFNMVMHVSCIARASDVDLKVYTDSISVELRSLVNGTDNIIIDKHNNLGPVLKKLRECRTGDGEVVSILHIGDSHIQAGFLSNNIRAYFQQNFSDAGRGLISPLKIAKTNEPSDYEIFSNNDWTAIKCTEKGLSERVGITGIDIITQQKSIEFTITSPSEFCVVRAFHHPQAPMLYEPVDLQVGSYCVQDNTPSSTTIVLNKNVTNVTLSGLAEGEYNVGHYSGFSLENGRPGVLYHAVGVNGVSFEHYNKSSSLAQQSALLAPNLIIIALGTNDAFGNRFDADFVYKQVEMMVQELKTYNPNASILLTTPMQCSKKTYSKGRVKYALNDNMSLISNVILKVALNNKVACWDAYAACGGRSTCEKWSKHGLFQKDMVHLTKEGYEFKAKIFEEAFSSYYNSTI